MANSCEAYVDVITKTPAVSVPDDFRATGRVLFIKMDSTSNRLSGDLYQPDFVTLDLPEELFPERPEDVGVVVGLYWGQEFVGTYDGGSQGYRETCLVRVFDADSGRLVFERTVVGGDPPEVVKEHRSIDAHSEYYGEGCDEEIIETVTELYR